MKNKEIEVVLNYMKQYVENKYEQDSEPMLNYKNLKIVLSYIKQLEKENKILRENAEHNDKVVDKLNWEIKILKQENQKVNGTSAEFWSEGDMK